MICTAKPNLYRDDLDTVAREIFAKVQGGRGHARVVWITAEGFVESRLKCEVPKMKQQRSDLDMIGTYDRGVTMDVIRGDLKARMAEIATAMLRRAA